MGTAEVSYVPCSLWMEVMLHDGSIKFQPSSSKGKLLTIAAMVDNLAEKVSKRPGPG